MKAGKTLVFRGKQAVAIIEITSGVSGTLLKLADKNDSDFGKELTQYLFWLEMLSLGGEVAVFLKKSARNLLKHEKKIIKTIDNAADSDEFLKHLDEVGEVTSLRAVKKAEALWKDFTYKDLMTIPPTKRPCFLAGTLVKVDNNYLPIEEIIIGTLVETYNFNEKKVELQKVSKVYNHFTEQYLEIVLTNNETINITGMHKVWIFNANKWKKANELTLKDTLFNPIEKEEISIKKLTIINKEEKTYNLEVAKNHNFMVSKKNILNHNSTKVFKYSSTETFDFAFYLLKEGAEGNQIDRYVGITVREHLDIRMGEHRIEGERALAGIKKYNAWKADVNNVSQLTEKLHTKMTFFEARVWEQYWISKYGGGKAHKGEGKLFNRSNSMSKKAFDDWKKKGKFNPCKFFIK